MKTLITVYLIAFGMAATACEFNADCEVGSQCIKQAYHLDGVCMGGAEPGNAHDAHPSGDIARPSIGRTCTSNGDCDGAQCLKSAGRYEGVCY